MADGKSRAAWSHTSAILSLIANAYRDPKKRRRPYQAREFNPHTARTHRRPLTVEQLTNDIMKIAKSREGK
jgi:hypothetical protein